MYSVKPVGLVLSDLLICPWMHHNVAGSVLPTHNTQQRVHQQSRKTKRNKNSWEAGKLLANRTITPISLSSSYTSLPTDSKLFHSPWGKTPPPKKTKNSPFMIQWVTLKPFVLFATFWGDTLSNRFQHKLFKYFFLTEIRVLISTSLRCLRKDQSAAKLKKMNTWSRSCDRRHACAHEAEGRTSADSRWAVFSFLLAVKFIIHNFGLKAETQH